MMRFTFAALGYVACSFLTFGHSYVNHVCDRQGDWVILCTSDREMGSLIKGSFWPIYWAGYGSIKIFD